MASSIDFVQYIVDQCSKAGDIVAKKMFDDYGIYCDRKIFGLICDDKFFLKPTETVRPIYARRYYAQKTKIYSTCTVEKVTADWIFPHILRYKYKS